MKPSEMVVGVRYIVTKASKHQEFQIGDKIALFPDGDVGNFQARGWMDAADMPAAGRGMECEIDYAWANCRANKLRADLAKLELAGATK